MTGVIPKAFLDYLTPCGGYVTFRWPAEENGMCSICWRTECARAAIAARDMAMKESKEGK
jgi:hypothetical protein